MAYPGTSSFRRPLTLDKANYPPLLAQLLCNRGVTNANEAEAFLSTKPISHDPLTLPGMEAAVYRLKQAIDRTEHIAVFGDFDVDRVTATAILARALNPLNVAILPYIPHRVEEGHGLSLQADAVTKLPVIEISHILAEY